MSKVNIDNINWKQYKIIDPLQGYSKEKLSKIINFKNAYDIQFVENKLKNEFEGQKVFDENNIDYFLFQSEFGHNLFSVYTYLKNKTHYAKHVLQISETSSNEDLSLFLQIYEKIESDIKWLDKIHLYYTYATRKQEKSYVADANFQIDELINIFSDNFIRSNIIKDQQFNHIYESFAQTNEYILGIYFPSNKERIAEAYSGPITYSPKESFIIYYDCQNNNFIFRGATKYENVFKNALEKYLNINLIEWDEGITFNPKVFLNRLQQKPKNSNITLTALHIKGLALGKNIDILLSQTVLKKNDISCKIKQLMNSKAVEINSFKDIDYLKIFYKVPEKNTFKEREIKIVYDPSNTKVKLVLDNKDLVPSEKTFLLKNFEEEFGVPLGQTIKPELFQNGIIDLYKHILLKNIVDDLEKSSLNVFNILISSNIIKIEEDNLWYCDNCNTFNEAKNTKCINCEYKPESIKYFSTYSIDENKIINLVKDIFKEKMPYYQFQQNINNAKYKGFTIRDEFDNEIYIILSINKLTSTDIKKLKSETKAIIFILSNQNSSTDNLIIQNDLFSYIPLEYILAYKDIGDKNFIDDYIKNACIECISKANIQSEIETIKSINVIKNSYLEYKEAQDKGDLFEDDVYNLFRYIFKTTMQLGKKTKGKRLPDGYFDIHLIQGAGVKVDKKYTLVWDAKYSDLEEGYDFSISEKRKITEYISNFNKNYEITNFSSSKMLDVFIIIYNNISASKFKEIAKYIRENTDWKGKLIFFDIASLVILTEYLLQNSKSYESKKNIFNSDFMTKLLKIDNISEYNYNVIENDDVLDFVNYFSKRTPTVQTIPNLIE